jgi:hypothetical protein
MLAAVDNYNRAKYEFDGLSRKYHGYLLDKYGNDYLSTMITEFGAVEAGSGMFASLVNQMMGDPSVEPIPPIEPGDAATQFEIDAYNTELQEYKRAISEKTKPGYVYPNEQDAGKIILLVQQISSLSDTTEYLHEETLKLAVESVLRGQKPSLEIMLMFHQSGVPTPSKHASDANFAQTMAQFFGPAYLDEVDTTTLSEDVTDADKNRLALISKFDYVPVMVGGRLHYGVRIHGGEGVILVDAMIRYYDEAYGSAGLKKDYVIYNGKHELTSYIKEDRLHVNMNERNPVTGAVTNRVKRTVAVFPTSTPPQVAISYVRAFFPDIGSNSMSEKPAYQKEVLDKVFQSFGLKAMNMSQSELVNIRYRMSLLSTWPINDPSIQVSNAQQAEYNSSNKSWGNILDPSQHRELLGKGITNASNQLIIEINPTNDFGLGLSGEVFTFDIDEMSDVSTVAYAFSTRFPAIKEMVIEDKTQRAKRVLLKNDGNMRISHVRIPINTKGTSGREYRLDMTVRDTVGNVNFVKMTSVDAFEETTTGIPEAGLLTLGTVSVALAMYAIAKASSSGGD